MAKPKPSRKRLFRASLAIAGMTAAQWARKQGITPQYLSMVLNRKHISERLTAKIDAFIGEHLQEYTTTAA
jgi:hypothetical protein